MTDIQTIPDSFLRESYDKIKHKSGLTIYVFRKALTTAYASLTVRFGSLDTTFRLPGEADFQTTPAGIAHFLEHKMFESEDHIDTFDKFAAVGASANAYTSNDLTSYLFSTGGRIEEALRILFDYVSHPYFTEENVEKEQGIIRQEIKMYDDSPGNRLYYAVLDLLYHRHRIRENICGSAQSIAGITPALLLRCYHAFYHPSNMVLTVCGDIATDAVLALADEYLPETTEKVPPERSYPDEPPAIRKKQRVFTMDIARPILCVGIKDTEVPADPLERVRRSLAMNLINDVCFGESSAFYNRLYDKGLISGNFSASYESLADCGHTLISAAADHPDEVLTALLSEFSALRDHPPTPADFERMRRVHYAEFVKDFDSTEEIASALLDADTEGVPLFDTGALIRDMDYSFICPIIKSFFDENHLAYAIANPLKGCDKTNA